MTNEEFFALPAEKQDDFLTACEAGWVWSERAWEFNTRLLRLLWGIFALLVLTNAGWIGLLFYVASRNGEG